MVTEADLRKSAQWPLIQFGMFFGLVLAILGVFFFLSQKTFSPYLFLASVVVLALSALWPESLLCIQNALTALGLCISWIFTKVVLSCLFYLVITPVALLARLRRKDFLDTKRDKNASTYWTPKPQRGPKALERQY